MYYQIAQEAHGRTCRLIEALASENDFSFEPGFDICGRCLKTNPPITPKEDDTILLWLDKHRSS